MQLIAWTILSLITAMTLRNRPFLLLSSAFVLWCAVPGVAAHILVGPALSGLTLHPAAIMILATFAVQVAVRPAQVAAVVAGRFEMVVILGSVCFVAIGLGLTAKGLDSFAMSVEQVGAPVAAFLLMGLCLQLEPRRLDQTRTLVLAVAAAEAALAVLQSILKTPIVFTADFESEYWFNATFDRWMGTLDHPLLLGVLLAAAIPLLTSVRRSWALSPLLLLMLAALVVAQSRVALGLGAAGVLYVLASRRSKSSTVTVSVVVISAAVYAYQSGYFDALSQRVEDDTGSAAARGYAWTYFSNHVTDYLWLGKGLGSSYDVAGAVGLGTSFENSFVMFAIDLGLVTALLYFGVMAACVLRAVRTRARHGLPLACVASFIAPLTFSGLSSRTVAGCLVWLIYAMAAYGTAPDERGRSPRRAPDLRVPDVAVPVHR